MGPCPRQALPSGNIEKAREGAACQALRICPALGPRPSMLTVGSCPHPASRALKAAQALLT